MISSVNLGDAEALLSSLKLQVSDLEYVIGIREEESELLRGKIEGFVELKASLEDRVFELESTLEEVRARSASGNGFYPEVQESSAGIQDLSEKYSILQTELRLIKEESAEANSLYSLVLDLRNRVTELESKLEISEMDRDFLQGELIELRESLSEEPTSSNLAWHQ